MKQPCENIGYCDVDPKSFGRVAVLMGGMSSERKVSLSSGSGVLQALRDKGVDAQAFDPAVEPVESLQGRFDRVMISLHGRFGEDGTVQGVLEYLQIPYTGPGVMASAIAMDKAMTRRVWTACGIPVARGMVLTSADEAGEVLERLGPNIVVKPSGEGSSVGVIKLRDATREDVAAALSEALRYDATVLVEERIFGRELTVAVIDGRALPIVEICAPDGTYDYYNKYFGDAVHYECPAKLAEDVEKRIRRSCEEAFAALGARGWGRIDVMLREDGSFILLELNTSPGMTPHSLVPMAARAVGLDYGSLCVKILSLAGLDHVRPASLES
ncbi:MAG: D-alanine--D-alanine ligase [Duodenibacillus sp.]